MSKARQTPSPDADTNPFLRLRERARKSQAEIGREIGYTDKYVYMMEKGKIVPPLSAVSELARAYGVPEHEIEDEIVALHRLRRKLSASRGAA